MIEHRIPIPARAYNAAVGGHVCGPEDIDFGQKVVHLIKYDKDGNEVSFESQVTQANKIYVIHDNFVLNANVEIPANCVLEFDGGSISGDHTITGNNTGIKAGLVKIFNTDVTFAGTWNVVEAYPEWCGAVGDGVTDDRAAIQSAIHIGHNIIFIPKVYYVTNVIKICKSHTHLILNGATIFCDKVTTYPPGHPEYGWGGGTVVFNGPNGLGYTDPPGIIIEDVGIEGGIIYNTSPNTGPNQNNENAIGFSYCKDFYCKNMYIPYCNRKGITCQYYVSNGIIENCTVENCGYSSIMLESYTKNITINNCRLLVDSTKFGPTYVKSAIKCTLYSENITIKNCYITSDVGDCIYAETTGYLNITNVLLDYSAGRGLVYSPSAQSKINISDCIFNGPDTNFTLDLYNAILDIVNVKGIERVRLDTCEGTCVALVAVGYITNAKPSGVLLICNSFYEYLDTTNATADTRAKCFNNHVEDDYMNWKPSIYDDIKNGTVYSNIRNLHGSTRPILPESGIGTCFFDTSLSPERPIWYKGNSVWVDATGATV